MEKTVLALYIILSILQTSLYAQENAVITALKKKYNEKTSLELTFDLDIFWKVREKHEKKSGSLRLMPGDKFRLAIGSTELISDGHTYWQYNEKTSQVIIKSLLDVDLSMHPSQVIKTYLGYSYKVKSDDAKQTVLTWSTTGPDQKKTYKAITLWVNKKKNTIEKVRAVDKNGNESTYTFKKTKTGAQFPSTLFDFEVPKGVDILDTRK